VIQARKNVIGRKTGDCQLGAGAATKKKPHADAVGKNGKREKWAKKNERRLLTVLHFAREKLLPKTAERRDNDIVNYKGRTNATQPETRDVFLSTSFFQPFLRKDTREKARLDGRVE
jgi:hypothetical protein